MPSHMPSGLTWLHAPSQLPKQMPSQLAPAEMSQGPTHVPSQGQPFVQSMPTGPVLPPSAVPLAVPEAVLDALLVLLAPGPLLPPDPSLAESVAAIVAEPESLESSFVSSPHATASSTATSRGRVGSRGRISG